MHGEEHMLEAEYKEFLKKLDTALADTADKNIIIYGGNAGGGISITTFNGDSKEE